MLRIFLLLAVISFIGIGLLIAIRWLVYRNRAQQRWFGLDQSSIATSNEPVSLGRDQSSRTWIGKWLYRAGFRSNIATPVFVISSVVTTSVGLTLALVFTFSGLQDLMEATVVLVPGGVGETFLPVVWVAPWLLFFMVALVPWLIVRRARRQRVALVEQDLPLALEMLSTLSEAGLGFDIALTRILRTRLGGRPLAEDFQMFQADLLAGRPRVESLRRLSDRMDITSVSVFVSAMVQAEQLGMGIARVLRQQADDVRARRRERSIAFANSLPVKRVIPLVVCFLPGLFVWTLGPAFVQLFKIAEAFVQVRDF